MKRYNLIALAALVFQACATEVTLSNEVLLDKIKGGWAGQAIACTYGGPTEFKYQGRMIPDSIALEWPDHIMKWYYDFYSGLYDDVYMDLTFVDVFDRKGLDAPVGEFANAFAYAGYQLWHANLQGRVNIVNGLLPPESGYWKNNPHADDIDFQIEADYAGLMSPGMPHAASHYCDAIGHIMNFGDGWYGGVYVAAMYSLAFVNDDIETVVREALKVIPSESRYARCMADIIRCHDENPDDWKAAWKLCQDKWTVETDCPDEPGSPFRIDAVVNGAYIITGLLYGEGDFDRTMEIATRCGQDSDCNPASAIGILSTMNGYSAIPEKYLANLHEVEDIPFAYTDISLNKAYGLSYKQALQVIALNGGKVTGDGVAIKIRKPSPVRYEKSFEGLTQADPVNIEREACLEDVDFSFEGCALVLQGYMENQGNEGYAAELEISIDGNVFPATIRENSFSSQDHLLHTYDLENGRHEVKVHVKNPRADKPVFVQRAIIYVPEY